MLYRKIDPDSGNYITSALNFFQTPPSSVSIANAMYREYLTLNPVTYRPFNFKIHPITSFIDLSKCYIFTEMKIRKKQADGTLVDLDQATDVVAPIQMIGATFIKNIKIAINGQEIYNGNQLSAYKTYLDTELSYPPVVKDCYLTNAGYSRDSADQNSVAGTGYVNRKNMFARSKTAQFMTKIDADIFNQELYLINNCEVDIEITPHDSDFLLIQPRPVGLAADKTYVLEITNCRLHVKAIDLVDGLALDVARRLDTQPVRYGLKKTILKSLFITEGRSSFVSNIFTDQVPRRVMLGMVDNNAYTGNKNTSPFMFKPFNIKEISINASGRTYPAFPYELDFPAKNYSRAFNDFNENLGLAPVSMDSNGITHSMFGSGWTIFVFNLNNSGEDDPAFQLIKEGTTAVSLKFDQPVPAGGIYLIIYGEYDQLLMVDRNRTLTSDITV